MLRANHSRRRRSLERSCDPDPLDKDKAVAREPLAGWLEFRIKPSAAGASEVRSSFSGASVTALGVVSGALASAVLERVPKFKLCGIAGNCRSSAVSARIIPQNIATTAPLDPANK